MRVGICAVGAELVNGSVVDRNSAWLASRLVECGANVTATLVVDDDQDLVIDALRWLSDRAELIVVGGGLGPTSDDITRDAVAAFAGVPLEVRPALVAHLAEVYERLERPMPSGTRRQAEIPAGAAVHPPRGTAAGFALEVQDDSDVHDGSDRRLRLHVLPGVPWEFRATAETHVLPEATEASGGAATITRTIHVAGLGESGIGASLTTLTDRLGAARRDPDHAEHGIDLAFLATDDEVLVKVTARGADPVEARRRAAPIVDEVVTTLGDAVTSVDEVRLEQAVVALLERVGSTVATVDVGTGGRLAALLSSVPSAGNRVGGGVVATSAEQAARMVRTTIPRTRADGAGNAGIARTLATAARAAADVDIAVAAVSGGFEEGASGADAFWAIATADGVTVERRHIPAVDRDLVHARSAAFALEALRRQLMAATSPTAAAPHPVTP